MEAKRQLQSQRAEFDSAKDNRVLPVNLRVGKHYIFRFGLLTSKEFISAEMEVQHNGLTLTPDGWMCDLTYIKTSEPNSRELREKVPLSPEGYVLWQQIGSDDEGQEHTTTIETGYLLEGPNPLEP